MILQMGMWEGINILVFLLTVLWNFSRSYYKQKA